MRTAFLLMALSLATSAYAQSNGRRGGNGGGLALGGGVSNRPPYGSLPMPTAALSTAAVLAAFFIGKKLKK